MNVLIVDPSRTVTATLSSLFAKHGFEPRVAKLGNEALETLQRSPTDLLCFAYELGDMNGIEMFVTAKARKLLHHQPVVMFTSTLRKSVVNRALDAGVTECFQKCNLDHFEHFIENFAVSHRQRISGTVLLVEDSATSVMYYRQVLERIGLVVEVSRSAEDAIERFAAEHFDLVVTDYVLSGKATGFAVVRAVRDSLGKKALTPILVISSFDETARKVEVLRNGANDFVAKPVVAEEMEVRVSNLMKMQKMMRRLENQHEAMKTLAMRDPLTGLCNRHHLHEIMPGLIADAHEESRALSLLVLDLDHFKQINDTRGHDIGDRVLAQAAKTLQALCRGDDLVARVGGEEFVVALPGMTLDKALDRAESVRAWIESLTTSFDVGVSASIGVAEMGADENYEQLFKRADGAMYRAKQAGRNRVEAA